MGCIEEGRILAVNNSPWRETVLKSKLVKGCLHGSKQASLMENNRRYTTKQNRLSKITNYTRCAKKLDVQIFTTVGQVEMLLS
jgi:hypothetical protein